MSYKISSSSRIFQSQTEYGWLTRPCLSCHMWKVIMQLGQAQPAFADWEKVWLDMWLGMQCRGCSMVNRRRFSFTGLLA